MVADINRALRKLCLVFFAICAAMASHACTAGAGQCKPTGERAALQASSETASLLQFSGDVAKTEPGEEDAQHKMCQQVIGPSEYAYNLAGPGVESYSQVGQDSRLLSILGSIKDGFFIESGAADGETNSNTLMYEKRGWNGLLVEPNPNTFQTLLGKHRKAHAFNGALSTTGASGAIALSLGNWNPSAGDGQMSTVIGAESASPSNRVQVPMVPVETLLSCIGRKTVDFWSLDVEGVEQHILKATPFDKIEVGALLIEMNKDASNNQGIEDVMKKYQFKEVGRTDFDRIYINPTYFSRRGLSVPERV